MDRNRIEIIVRFSGLLNFNLIISGINRVISTSKIKKITAIKKNCNEKGNRDLVFGSNPHSNGLLFSRSLKVFFDNSDAMIIITRTKVIIVNPIIIINIIYTNFS